MVLVMMFLSTTIFLWTLSQNTMYNEAVRARNQEEADRRSENVVAVSGNYSVNEITDEVTVNVVLKNAGSVAVQIINLWVLDSDPSNQRYTNKSLNLNLKSGDVLNLVGSSGLKVTIPGADPSHNFTSWFVTSKGNTVPLEKEQEGIIVSQVSQGIGSVGMDFGSFVYYHVDYVSRKYRLRQSEWPNGLGGFSVPKGPNIAFRVILTNFDTKKRTINLTSPSVLWMLFPTSDVPHSVWWYIVNVDGTGTISSTYSQISLPYAQPTMVYFASSNDLGKGSFSTSSSGRDGPAAVNLMLFGTIGISTFGQNIPFVSVYFT